MTMMRPNARWSCLLAVALALTAPSPRAQAQKGPQARCDASPACTELLQKAREHSVANRLADALQLYDAAYKVQPDPRLLYNSALRDPA
jgi:hypothetical protein